MEFVSASPGVLSLICLVGIYLAYLYGRKTKRFRWREYAALLAAPLFCVSLLVYQQGIKVFYLFVASAAVGLLLEYSIGLSYHKTLNRRLWTYNRYSLGGYTSWLVVPMWGVAGVVFWLLSVKVGL
jgi:hypothetical protein